MKQPETERLVFRRYENEDENDFTALFTDAVVMKYVGDGVLTGEQAQAFWQKLFGRLYPQNFNIWAICAKDNSRYIGHAGIYLRPTNEKDWEFVYFLKQSEWGKGYATEIARKVIKFGFEELNLSEIFATVDDEHLNSIRVLEKSGMKFERFEHDDSGQFSVYAIRKN